MLEFLGVALSVALSAGVFVLIAAFARRIRNTSSADSGEKIDQLQARLEQVEQRLSESEERDERLDFLERIVVALREGKAVPQGLPPRKQKTPV